MPKTIPSVRTALATLAAVLLAVQAMPARAAERTIRIDVPYSPGGPTDAMARILQGPLQQTLGATVLIDNVAGAGGALGAQQVLRAPADGATFFLGNNGPSAVTPLLQTTKPFDPLKDFVPVSMIAKATMQIAVSGNVPAADMASLLTHVPYKGQAPTLNALLGNEVQMLLTAPTDAK